MCERNFQSKSLRDIQWTSSCQPCRDKLADRADVRTQQGMLCRIESGRVDDVCNKRHKKNNESKYIRMNNQCHTRTRLWQRCKRVFGDWSRRQCPMCCSGFNTLHPASCLLHPPSHLDAPFWKQLQSTITLQKLVMFKNHKSWNLDNLQTLFFHWLF